MYRDRASISRQRLNRRSREISKPATGSRCFPPPPSGRPAFLRNAKRATINSLQREKQLGMLIPRSRHRNMLCHSITLCDVADLRRERCPCLSIHRSRCVGFFKDNRFRLKRPIKIGTLDPRLSQSFMLSAAIALRDLPSLLAKRRDPAAI
ncbi:MAG: hypothetical protein ABIQ32_00430 [Sphingomicrobium sp.]